MDQISNDNAYAAPAAAPGGVAPIKGTGWAKFWGIMTLIGGAGMCMSIIMLPLGVPYVFAGLAVLKGAEETESFNQSRDPETADRALREFLKHFRIIGIVTVIIVALYLLAIVGFIIAAAAGVVGDEV